MKKFDKILKILVIATILLIIPTFAMEFIETDNFIFNFIRDCLDYLFLVIGGLSAGMMMIKLGNYILVGSKFVIIPIQ